MNNMKIVSSKKRIAINEDENRVIEINPGNTLQRKKYYELFSKLEKIGKDLAIQSKGLDDVKDFDKIVVLEEQTFNSIAKEIDAVFGKGTIQKITEGEKDLEMLVQFFEGLTPYFQNYNKEKISKYGKLPKNKTGVMK